ncbi:Protein yippee-like 2 [Blattella germanica]|nr:Protein yippee-like 2 [Blattella germanica]
MSCGSMACHEAFRPSRGLNGNYLYIRCTSVMVNVGCGPAEERVLLTGLHAVADIYCECCKTTLGWKYEHAFESSQKYKEGKYIIELAHMIKENGWD